MIHIALCDDQVKITTYIEGMTLELSRLKSIDVGIDVFFDGTTLNRHIELGSRYDLIFLDIEMKIMNGVETAKRIRAVDSDVLLIYVSSHENYWKDLFEVEPFRFISKPINKKEFAECFYKACEKLKRSHVFFEFKYNRELIKIKINDIVYFESYKRTIYLYTNSGETYKFYGKLTAVEQAIQEKNATFLRIHQSDLVNYRYIKKVGVDSVVLYDGNELLISAKRQKEIKKKYCDLVGGDILDR
jgi:DNA-binding LytR/AlgR family response regulator